MHRLRAIREGMHAQIQMSHLGHQAWAPAGRRTACAADKAAHVICVSHSSTSCCALAEREDLLEGFAKSPHPRLVQNASVVYLQLIATYMSHLTAASDVGGSVRLSASKYSPKQLRQPSASDALCQGAGQRPRARREGKRAGRR